MRTVIRIILSLILVVAVVAISFAFWQGRQEESRLKNELERRSSILADSLKLSVEPFLLSENIGYLERLVEKFSNRERLIGVAIYDAKDALIASSVALKADLENNPKILAHSIQEVERLSYDRGDFVSLGAKQLHAYSTPLLQDEKVIYILTLVHDASYIQERVNRIWVNTFWRAAIQSFLIALVALVILYLQIMTPIRVATDWVRRIRQGAAIDDFDPKGRLLLGSLAEEIAKMAKSLEVARLAAEEEARLRQSVESLWTSERLKEFVKTKFQDGALFVVSNREPFMHLRKGKDIECIVPASGLVTALEPILNACGGTWIAQGSGSADKETVDAHDKIRVPPEEPRYTLRRVWVEKEEDEGFYAGFSNEGLWPLCHIAHNRPTFRSNDWQAYKAVNQKFAKAVLEEIQDVPNPYILIQDYHFALLPQMIKQKRRDAQIAIFWHIPWPNPESFGICPWCKDLLKGMLGADIIGFHTQFHCNNFIESVDRFLESRIDYEHFTVHRKGQTTWIKPFPISIDFHSYERDQANTKETAIDILKQQGIVAPYLGVGVDRLDYTKGIIERLRAIEHFLEAYPQYLEKFSFIELGAPSRNTIPKYQEFTDEVAREVARINTKFQQKNWQPIYFLMKHHSHDEILPFYKAADICLVTSLHDGMNLVAKEFVTAREDEKGVLILSQFTGAARDLRDALIVNPYDIVETAEAIRRGLEMSLNDQEDRMRRMRANVRDRNIYRWASEIIEEMARITKK